MTDSSLIRNIVLSLDMDGIDVVLDAVQERLAELKDKVGRKSFDGTEQKPPPGSGLKLKAKPLPQPQNSTVE